MLSIFCFLFSASSNSVVRTVNTCMLLQIPEETGGCRPFYSAPSASCSFKVEEFGKILVSWI